MLIVWLTIVLSLMSFVEIDIIEKNQDDDTDDVEIGRFLEDCNFEHGKDECDNCYFHNTICWDVKEDNSDK